MEQATIAELRHDQKRRQMRRERPSLAKMDGQIPRSDLERRTDPVCPKAGRTRRPYPLGAMQRVRCLQLFDNLGNPATENPLYEMQSVLRFAGAPAVGSAAGRHDNPETPASAGAAWSGNGAVLEVIDAHVAAQRSRRRIGAIMNAKPHRGAIVDQEPAPGARPEMHQTKKGARWLVGMKAHIGVEAKPGPVQSLLMTTAKGADATQAQYVLHGGEDGLPGREKPLKNRRSRSSAARTGLLGAISAAAFLLSPVNVLAQSLNSSNTAVPTPEPVSDPATTGQVPDQPPPAATAAPEPVSDPAATGQVPDQPPPPAAAAPEPVSDPAATGQVPDQPPPAATAAPEPVSDPAATGQVPDQPPPAATAAPEPVSDPAATGQVPDQPPPAATAAPEPVSDPAATGQVPDQPPPAAAAAPEPVSDQEGQPPASAEPRPATGQAARPSERPELDADVTQSHVLRATEDLITEIEVLRAEFAVSHFPPRAELIEGRAPVHVYAKSLEVLAKVIQVQHRMGLPPANMGHLPAKAIETADVFDHVEHVLRELRSIKTQMAVDRPIEFAPLKPGGTSSMHYRNLADASLMLDGLVGRTLTPADVYRNALSIFDELELIAAMLGVSLSFELSPIEQEIAPADVAAQILLATYKAINLQTRLQMEASNVPTMTLVRVSPTENYDATNLLLAEIARIKVHLGVTLTRADRSNLPTDQQSTDVFALVTLIARNIDKVAAAVGN